MIGHDRNRASCPPVFDLLTISRLCEQGVTRSGALIPQECGS